MTRCASTRSLTASTIIRSGQGPVTLARSMSGGNQQKAIVAREIDKNSELLWPSTHARLDVARSNTYTSNRFAAGRGKAVLLISLESTKS
jgi:simple sugar transport system ATP-binding protein